MANSNLNIIVRNLSKTYTYYTTEKLFFKTKHRTEAVKDISFDVRKSEVLGIVGPNGSGKTTIVKMVSGIISRDSGSVEINGEDPFDRSINYRKSVGIFLGQKNRLNPDTSLVEFAKIHGSMYKLSNEVINTRIKDLTAMLSLDYEKTLKPVRNLSLGERMKAEICITFLNYPSVCFLDEPTIGLDGKSQNSIREFLRSYVKKFQASIILTSHDMQDIEEVCERILLIKNGSSIYYGETNAIIDEFDDSLRINFQTNITNLKKLEEGTDFLNSFKVRTAENEVTIVTTESKKDDLINYLYKNLDIYNLNIETIPFEEMIERLLDNE